MKLYVGDYLADTGHLTATEHGAYLLLLMTMWRSRGSLANDDRALCRIAKMTVGQWAKSRDTLMAFFEVDEGRVTQRRLTTELQSYQTKLSKLSDSGRSGGYAKALKDKGSDVANAMANATPKSGQPEPEPEPEKNRSLANARDLPDPKPKRRWRRVPDGWCPSAADRSVGMGEGLNAEQIDRELVKFREWEFKDPKTDPSLAFRRWLRTAAEQTNDRHPTVSHKLQANRDNLARAFAGAQVVADARRREQLDPADC